MVVVHRFVADPAGITADELVERIAAERDLAGGVLRPAEIPIDGLADEQGDRHVAAPGAVAELAIGLLGESEVGRHQTGHGDMTVSRYRRAVNGILAA
jgi:hypothetical protein